MQGMVAGKETEESRDKGGRNTSHKSHRAYVWYDGSSKQSGVGQASISQRHLGSVVLKRSILREEIGLLPSSQTPCIGN